MPCIPCVEQFHKFCQNPPVGLFCCCERVVDGTTKKVEVEIIESKPKTGDRDGMIWSKDDTDIKNVKSTGRKRAAVLFPLDKEADCEWKMLKYAGGGLIPIVGCYNNKQDNRHHGPILLTLANFEGNVHRICSDCVVGTMRVLTENLNWVAAEDLRVGERLIGFTESIIHGQCYWEPSIVESVVITQEPCYRFITDDGSELISSHKHKWVSSAPSRGGINWRITEELNPGYRLKKVFPVWEPDYSWESGWLAGMLDGEGCLSGYQLSLAQSTGKNRVVADLMEKYLQEWSDQIHVTIRPSSAKLTETLVLRVANLYDIARIIGGVRPVKMLEQFPDFLYSGKKSPLTLPNNNRTIIHKEYLGMQDVYSIQTSSKTMIVEGYLSHNCHNRFHTLNDPFVKDFMRTVMWRPHDPETKISEKEFAEVILQGHTEYAKARMLWRPYDKKKHAYTEVLDELQHTGEVANPWIGY